jgi:hypothetical protein
MGPRGATVPGRPCQAFRVVARRPSSWSRASIVSPALPALLTIQSAPLHILERLLAEPRDHLVGLAPLVGVAGMRPNEVERRDGLRSILQPELQLTLVLGLLDLRARLPLLHLLQAVVERIDRPDVALPAAALEQLADDRKVRQLVLAVPVRRTQPEHAQQVPVHVAEHAFQTRNPGRRARDDRGWRPPSPKKGTRSEGRSPSSRREM